MTSVLIIYGSTMGNTEFVAETVGSVFKDSGINVTISDVCSVTAENLCDPYDVVLFGCSTWGDDTIELQDDFMPLFNNFGVIGAKGKKIAVFGCGDSGYTFYCGAVDLIEQSLEGQGAIILTSGLKIDGDPHTEKGTIEEWAKEILREM